MWQSPYSATGLEPATHFVSSGFIQTPFAELLGNETATAAAFARKGGQGFPPGQIKALYQAATIRFDAQERESVVLSELGLQPIRGEL
jgi:hypothetical protein